MKIAVISDIHANLDALESVLKDIKQEACSKILCLGDIVMAGPEPLETLKRIKELMQSKDFYIIRGNTDRMLSVFSLDTYKAVVEKNPVMGAAYLSDSKLLKEEDKEFLNKLPVNAELEFFGVKILLVHGSPRKDDENIYPGLDISEVEEIIKGVNADIIFCGHTHTPCGYQTNSNKTVVNVGSIGRPFTETPDSCYAILTVNEETGAFDVKHKFVKYDIESASQKVLKRKFEGTDKLAAMLKKPQTRYP